VPGRDLRLWQEREYPPAVFATCDVDQGTNFEDETFDFITCIAVLEHLFNPFEVVEEFRRILKDGGRLLISVPNVAYIKRRVRLLFGIFPRKGGASSQLTPGLVIPWGNGLVDRRRLLWASPSPSPRA
jgi:SAM-dependent methyltransferase